MATKVTNLENPQQIEAVVSGPEGANRLIICNGIAPIDQTADANTVTQIWTWLIGPVLSHTQFHRAICNGALIRISHSGGTANWSLVALDADFDDAGGIVLGGQTATTAVGPSRDNGDSVPVRAADGIWALGSNLCPAATKRRMMR